MVEGCGNNMMKILLIVFNLIFTILGLAAIILGAIALIDKDKLSVLTEIGDAGSHNYEVNSLLNSGAIVLIIAGVVILFFGGVGMCGACKDSTCLLMVYAVSVGLIFIIEIVAVILAAIFYGKITNEAKDFLTERLQDQYMGADTGDAFTVAINSAQVKFKCCGINNYMDFMNTTKWVHSNTTEVPITCCMLEDPGNYLDNPGAAKANDPNCQMSPTDANSYLDQGCYDAIVDYAKSNAAIIIGIGVGILVVEVFCILFACCLFRAKRAEE